MKDSGFLARFFRIRKELREELPGVNENRLETTPK